MKIECRYQIAGKLQAIALEGRKNMSITGLDTKVAEPCTREQKNRSASGLDPRGQIR